MENITFNKELHIKEYISVILRRKWTLIAFFLITVTAVTFATFKQHPIYRAVSTIIIDVAEPDILAVKDIIKLGETNYFAYRAYIETQQEIIKSRNIAMQVINNLGLADKEEFKKEKDPVGHLLKKLKVELVKDTRIIKISIDDKDPRQAVLIVNKFAKVYTDSNIASRINPSNEAETWLREEVDKQKLKVRESEFSLQAYKEKNNIVGSIEDKQNIINDALMKLNTVYLDAQRKRIQAESAHKSSVDTEGNLRLENLSTLLSNNEVLQQLKKDYSKQQAILAEYKEVYKNKHPKMIALFETTNYLKSRIKSEELHIKAEETSRVTTKLETEDDYAEEEEGKLKKLLDERKEEALEVERKIIEYNALKRELETNKRILDIVLNRMKETAISSQIQTNNVRIQDIAEEPKRPIKPKKTLNIALSIVLGIIGGLILVFFREYMDTTIKNSNDIVTLLQLPVLGSVPRIKPDGKNIRNKIDADRVVEKDSLCMASEAYRSIRTNLLFSLKDSGYSKSIAITSSVPKEGKTISAVNLAIMMADSGESVLLVDSDMRKPRVHTVFNIDNVSGFSNYLAGQVDFDRIIKYTGINNLSVIPAGSISHKSAELISSKNAKLFLEKAGARFSKIIFDAPPVALVTDAAVLSGLCDGVILIAEADRTTRDLLNNSKELLHKAGANIIGVILNNVSLTRNSYYYPQYYYGKYYKPLNAK